MSLTSNKWLTFLNLAFVSKKIINIIKQNVFFFFFWHFSLIKVDLTFRIVLIIPIVDLPLHRSNLKWREYKRKKRKLFRLIFEFNLTREKKKKESL